MPLNFFPENFNSRVRWGKTPTRGQTTKPFMVYGVQICRSVGLRINRHFEEARLLKAFYDKFKHFVQFSVNRAD